MPTLPVAFMSSLPGSLTLMVAVSTFEICSWPAYICCGRAMDFGGGGGAAASSVLESHAARPMRAVSPTATNTLRIGNLPVLIVTSVPTVAVAPQASGGDRRTDQRNRGAADKPPQPA